IQTASAVPNVEDNDVSGFYKGIELWNDPAGVTIEGGDISGNGIGIAAIDYSTYGNGATSAYVLDGVTLHDNGVDLQVVDTTVTVTGPTTLHTLNEQGSAVFNQDTLAVAPQATGTPRGDF